MRLTKLTLSGFKSFADKTDIIFDAPIACIVGPNGCGKSNTVDAIKWVLGEQSAKSLRGGEMMDVIFNGCSTRKPAAMASVTLTFDNSDRRLAMDCDTVAVTRRLYRDGSSEYLLNNQRCRLRDIRELFMDTGVGTDAYSIIEQGKVDVLLQANPQQRREIFEEAAGISRFKARKTEAVRKLERTEQNLGLIAQRLEDTERRLRSVKIQASRARNYQEYSTQLRQLQMTYLLADYHRLRVQLEQVVAEQGQRASEREQASEQMTQQQQGLAGAQREHQDTQGQVKQVEHDRLHQQSMLQQAQQRVEFIRSALADLQRQISADEGRQQEMAQRSQQLAQDLSSQSGQVDRLVTAERDAQGRLEQAQDRVRQLGHQLNQKQSELESEKAGVVSLMRRTAQLHNEIQSLSVFERSLSAAREKLDQRTQVVSRELEQVLLARGEGDTKHAQVAVLLEQQQAQLKQQEDEASQLDQRQRELGERLAGAKQQRAALDSRRAVLQEMQDRREGIADAVKAVLAQRDADRDGGAFGFVRGLLAQMIETDPEHPGHAKIVEAALGDYQHALVIDSLRDICGGDALQSLGGRVTFLPIDQFAGRGSNGQADIAPGQTQGCRCVLELVRHSDVAGPVVRAVLAKTWVVADLNTAAALRPIAPAGSRFVTVGGELLEADGRVTVGCVSSGAESGGGWISRRSELVRLERQIGELDQRITQDETELAGVSDQGAHIEKVSQELRRSIYEANSARIEVASRLEGLQSRIAQLEREQPVLAAEAQQVDRQLRDAGQQRRDHEDQARQLEQDSTGRQRAIAEMEAGIAGLAADVRAQQEAVASIRVEAGKMTEQLVAARHQVRQAEIAQADVERQQKLLDEQVAGHHSRLGQLQQDEFDARNQVEESQLRLKELGVRYDLMLHRLEKAAATVAEAEAALSRQQQLVEALDQQVHSLEVAKREAQVKSESVARCREQLRLEVEEAYQSYEPQEIDWPAVEAQIADLRGKLDRLGTVNLDAIGEQDELERAREDLAKQVEDIQSAKQRLGQLIREINDDSRKRFEETFEQLRENFAGKDGLFRRLFGGGRADLVLVPDEQGNVDVLESGIDIIAKPPGKEPRSISLLSGGEKTMTAVALLMSIFKARPSPFCVLDEVDAALDEANLDRFTQVVRSFLDRSHFVIITHQKRTMQAADRLYGITMPHRGISKQVSVRFEQVGADGQIAQEAIDASLAGEAAAPTITEPEPQEDVEQLVAVGAAADDEGREEGASLRHRLARMLDGREAVEVESAAG